MGATSGLGLALAERYINAGYTVGVAGRNEKALLRLVEMAPDRVSAAVIDILSDAAPDELMHLVDKCGGMDVYIHCSGIALLAEEATVEREVRVCETNTVGFTRMCTAAYNYFERTERPGRLVAITSIAGMRGFADLPAYSASKAYDSVLLEALRQRARCGKLPLRVVDIKPGWTRTPLLADDKRYMFEMDAEKVADMIFRASQKAKRSVVVGLRWKLLTALARRVPSALWERLHLRLWR